MNSTIIPKDSPKCEECGGNVIQVFADWVCEDCGLVMERKYTE